MPTAPSKQQITDASSTLDPTARAVILSLIRQSDRYRAAPLGFPDLQATIDVAGDERGIKSKQLNAALTLFEQVGSGEMEINEDGAKLSKPKDRDAIVEYMIAVLYDEPIGSFLSGKRVTSTVIRSPAGF